MWVLGFPLSVVAEIAQPSCPVFVFRGMTTLALRVAT